MLQNAYLLAKIGADTAENEQHFAEILPTDFAAVVYGRIGGRRRRRVRGRTVRPAEDDAAVELARETPFTSSAVDRVQRSAQVLKNALLIENDLKRCSFSLMY